MRLHTDYPYNSARFMFAYHFARLWQGRENPTTRDSLRQNIAAQRGALERAARSPR